MRVGMMLAAAAALVFGAGQASAQLFTQYRVSGTGTYQKLDIYGVSTGAAINSDFYADFDILSSAGTVVSPGIYYSDGFKFYGNPSNGDSQIPSADGTASGILSYKEVGQGHRPGPNVNVNLNYSDADAIGGFPLALASSVASGGLSIYYANPYSQSFYFTGTVTGFNIVGSSATFQALNLSTVPEPGVWAMMIAGVGAIGIALRGRRRSQLAAV